MNSSKKGQNFLLGALILLLSNIAVKVIGAIYRIPMYNMLGDGMAYFNAAYNFYVTIYLVSTAGIPVAISRMVAASDAKGNYAESKRILRIALGLFTAVGFLAMSIMMIFARPYAAHIGIDNSYLCMFVLAPTLFFICISSTFRGYYQGKKNMTLSAFAQVIEAFSKLCIGLLAVWLFLSKFDLHVTAAYAISGVTIGVIFSLLFALAFHARHANDDLSVNSDGYLPRTRGSILRELIFICIPIAVSSCITGLTGFVDNNLIVNGLTGAGVVEETAISLFSAYTSIVIPLFNMPPTLIYPLAISLLPNLTEAYTAGNETRARDVIDSSLRVAAILSLPCAVGMMAVPGGIIRSLFNEKLIEGMSVSNCDVTAQALAIISVSVFFLAMISITNSILQAWHKEYMPIVSAFCGVVVKWIVEMCLLRIPGVGVRGAAISTLACHFTILLLNTIFSVHYTGYFPKASKIFPKPLAAAVGCGVGAYGTYRLMQLLTNGRIGGMWQARICLAVSIAAAGLLYVLILGVLKGFIEEDIRMLPKGDKLCRILKKIKMMKA